MPALSPRDAEEVASELFELRGQEGKRLDRIRTYLRGKPELTFLPTSAPRELQALAMMARIPLMELIIKATTQQMHVDGYTTQDTEDGDRIWREVWQTNRWDRKQIGVHRSAAAYGVAYATSMPSEADAPPTVRALSPRQMTVSYGADDDWPQFALEQRVDGTWRLYDDERFYELRRTKRSRRSQNSQRAITFEHTGDAPHDQDVTPVVRYLADEDLDDPVLGDVEPNMTLQDQINLCTLHLLVAQHFGAFGRKILIGMMMDEVEKQLRASASSTLTIRAKPEDFAVEELSQTELDGFIASRESAARFIAAISQTPAHELLGTLSNLAATALLESRESTARKVSDRKIVIGESHEQLLGQAGTLLGIEPDPAARVRWRPVVDTRTMQFVEMLATLARRLGVPEEELWRETPFPDSTVAEWRAAKEELDTQQGRAGGPGASGEGAVGLAAL